MTAGIPGGDRLPELLALLYGAHAHLTTARGTLVHRQNTALWPKAHERYLERMRRHRHGGSVMTQRVVSRRGPKLPDVHEETVRFWWQPPDRLREEVASNIPHQNRTVVIDGGLWWLFGRELDAVTNELLDEEERAHHGVGGGERFRGLLDPTWLLPAVEVDEIAHGDGVLHVRARLRDDLEGPYLHHVQLVGGADDYELEVDAALGHLRAVTAWIDGEELSSTRLAELVRGEPFEPDLFARPPGVVFEAPGGHARQSTLEEAAAEAPFPLFFVPELPEGNWRLHVNCNRKPRFTVWLVYHRGDGRGSFTISQTAEESGICAGERTLVFERDGTHVVLQSDGLDRDTLRELGDRLRRFGG